MQPEDSLTCSQSHQLQHVLSNPFHRLMRCCIILLPKPRLSKCLSSSHEIFRSKCMNLSFQQSVLQNEHNNAKHTAHASVTDLTWVHLCQRLYCNISTPAKPSLYFIEIICYKRVCVNTRGYEIACTVTESP
jgi:hypothetical protein